MPEDQLTHDRRPNSWWEQAARDSYAASLARREETRHKRRRRALRQLGTLILVAIVVAYCLLWSYTRITAPIP